MEFYLDHGLIQKEEYLQKVREFRKPGTVHKNEWLAAFEKAVVERAKAPLGLFFSGGIDSTFIGFILQKNNIPFTAYTVGFQDGNTKAPDDIIVARKIATLFGWNHKEWVMNTKDLDIVLRKTTDILGETANPITASVGAVVVAAAELAKADGITTLLGGLGSEEIFAGYRRHDKAKAEDRLDEERWKGLLGMYERDLIRDCKLAEGLGITVLTPFLDPEVISLAMQFPPEDLIKDGHKKYILRLIAQEEGLAHEFAFRPKQAAQYGSRINKAIYRMGRKQGMKKSEYLGRLRE